MGKRHSKASLSAAPNGAEDRPPVDLQRKKNVLLIWLDKNIDENNDDCQNTITKLRRTMIDTNIFTDVDQCFKFIQTVVDTKVCMIVSGSLGQNIMPRVHNMSQIDSIFIFCDNQKLHEQWVKDWPKIRGIFTDITLICEALKEAAHQCEQNAIPMSFIGSNERVDQLDPSFMYTQIIKETILTIQFKQNSMQYYFDYCSDIFEGITKEIEDIKQLEDEYHNKTPVCWYACQLFLFPMLNRALRVMDADIIARMSFFISDLHRQIEQLHQKQYAGATATDTFTVYRGQGLSMEDFEQMMKIKGGLISFNSFLSTNKDRNISHDFVQRAIANPDQVGVLFIMKINPAQSTTSFASIAGISDFEGEEEVLFSMHSVFRIQNIEQIGENNRLYEVNLVLTADNDPELNRLNDYIRQESYPNSVEWYRLGLVLSEMGQFDKAEDIYQDLLRQIKEDKDKTPLYYQLGLIKYKQEKYKEALTFYEKSFAIYQKYLPPNHSDLSHSYHNIGLVHRNMGNYSKALSLHEKALKIRQQSLPSNHPDVAASYNSIGSVYERMGNYSKARTFYEQAVQIAQKTLLSNHPDLQKWKNNLERIKNR
ncbi:unnamed protein product [Adineta steineri]|uniref:ADP ribosyltransferase domain-containing protein n=1 Tax=Adineta steineri TaxID=433720 RepID=A0A814XAS0_9BILA|nr:unnamed protein product [Adineta steineri]CAF1496152.1 unnamed protein product [Adineta steineri]